MFSWNTRENSVQHLAKLENRSAVQKYKPFDISKLRRAYFISANNSLAKSRPFWNTYQMKAITDQLLKYWSWMNALFNTKDWFHLIRRRWSLLCDGLEGGWDLGWGGIICDITFLEVWDYFKKTGTMSSLELFPWRREPEQAVFSVIDAHVLSHPHLNNFQIIADLKMVSGVKAGDNRWFSLETMSTFSVIKPSFNMETHCLFCGAVYMSPFCNRL